jgi:hypothetical protein
VPSVCSGNTFVDKKASIPYLFSGKNVVPEQTYEGQTVMPRLQRNGTRHATLHHRPLYDGCADLCAFVLHDRQYLFPPNRSSSQLPIHHSFTVTGLLRKPTISAIDVPAGQHVITETINTAYGKS